MNDLVRRNIELSKHNQKLLSEVQSLERKKKSDFEAMYRGTIMALSNEATEVKHENKKLRKTLDRYEEKYDYLANGLYHLKKKSVFEYPDIVPFINELIEQLHNKNFCGNNNNTQSFDAQDTPLS